jgi:hypothetical protein
MMVNCFRIIGVHHVESNEPCHLIEVDIDDMNFDWTSVTQRNSGRTREEWQAAYDEQPVPGRKSWAFFFHDLDFSRPLVTKYGEIALPSLTPIPEHLKQIDYSPP